MWTNTLRLVVRSEMLAMAEAAAAQARQFGFWTPDIGYAVALAVIEQRGWPTC